MSSIVNIFSPVLLGFFLKFNIYIYINRIWDEITEKGWYAIPTNQPTNLPWKEVRTYKKRWWGSSPGVLGSVESVISSSPLLPACKCWAGSSLLYFDVITGTGFFCGTRQWVFYTIVVADTYNNNNNLLGNGIVPVV